VTPLVGGRSAAAAPPEGRGVDRGAGPGHPQDAEASRIEVGQARLVVLLVAAPTVLQRFALPFGGGQVPLVLPIVLAVVAWAAHRQILRAEPVRSQWFLLVLVTCAAAATVTSWRGGSWSALSIIYLAATYAPFALTLRRPSAARYEHALSLFLVLMNGAAVIAVAQVGLQLIGMAYLDPVQALPSSVLLHGYQTSYPVIYGSGIFKANGGFFLEPSFCSQFLALALVVRLHLRRWGPGAYLLMAGIVATVSGTGVILALIGLGAVGLSERRRQLLRIGAGVLVAAFLVAVSPAGSIFMSRIDESSSSTSSASGRFRIPYQVAVDGLSSDPLALLAGRGPGDAERTSLRIEKATGVTAVFPVVPKVAIEYGVPALVMFLGFVLTATLRGVPSRSLAVPVLVMYFTLSGSLLQPATVYLLYLMTSLFALPQRSSLAVRATASR
jgi:hypothetical protein